MEGRMRKNKSGDSEHAVTGGTGLAPKGKSRKGNRVFMLFGVDTPPAEIVATIKKHTSKADGGEKQIVE
jgi:hypothetical protein